MWMGCQTIKTPDTKIETSDTKKVMNDEIRGEGTIIWNEFEGGFFGIQSKTGAKYYPLGPLDQNLQVSGIAVKFVLKPQAGVMTAVMWGTPVSVISIKRTESQK